LVHLSDLALSVVQARPRTSDYVFAASGKQFGAFSRGKRELDERAGVHGWRLHDLRRTAVSGMARLGVAPHVADKILNHTAGTIAGVAAVYQRHDFMAERKAALELWSMHLSHLSG
jgi:integrase